MDATVDAILEEIAELSIEDQKKAELDSFGKDIRRDAANVSTWAIALIGLIVAIIALKKS